MKLLEASLGYKALVDDADFAALSKYRWYAHNNGTRKEKRPARRTGVAEGRKVRFLHHHIITPPEGMVVDHINGDPWDNRRVNLRVCTHAENLCNQRQRKGRGGLVKGVYKRGKHYHAKVAHNRRIYDLGYYSTVKEAGLAYDSAALFLHGEFACPNYPEYHTVAADPVLIRSARRAVRAETPNEVLAAIELMQAGLNSRQASERTGADRRKVQVYAAAHGVAARRGRPTRKSQAVT